MSEEWKALGENEKEVYQQTSDREKEKYMREMRAFKEKLAKAGDVAEANPEKATEKVVGKKRGGPGAGAKAAATQIGRAHV